MGHDLGAADQRFWSLIGRLGPDLNPRRLSMALTALSWVQVHEFRRTMTVMVASLGSPAHRLHGLAAYEHRFPPAAAGLSTMVQPAPFDELTMTVVALGRDPWSAVLNAPELLAGSWPTTLGRQLVTVADAALAHVTCQPTDRATR